MNTTEFFGFQRILGAIYAPFLRRCDLIIFGCQFQEAMWIDKYRLDSKRCIHIYNGVDSSYFSRAESSAAARSLRVQLGIPESSIIIGSVGRLAPEKNYEMLFECVARCAAAGQDVYLLLVGDGEERLRLTGYSNSLGMGSRTRLLGSLADVRPALAAMDVFVLPSKTETFSNAALEAMSMECPVVLSKVGGAAEMIENGQNGFLFESGNIPELTKTLRRLNDSEVLRARIGAGGRQRILDRFQFAAMVEKYRELIENKQAKGDSDDS
jgi:glycosyltransferase involved in cell wall biosynthesis